MSSPTPLRVKDGYWTTTWYDSLGKQRKRRFGSVSQVSRREAGRAYSEWVGRFHADPSVRDPGITHPTIDELAKRYIAWCKVYYRKPDGSQTREAENIECALGELRRLYGSTPAAAW